jgi:hypothetical protein
MHVAMQKKKKRKKEKSVEKKKEWTNVQRKKENTDSPCFLAKFLSSKREIYFQGAKVELGLATIYTPIHHIPYTCTS